MKINIKAFIKEILPIIAGILIAMFINNWNEDRKDKKYIAKIFTSINKELSETEKDITIKIKGQNALADTLDYYKNNEKISILNIVTKVKGIYIPTIKINAWKAVSNSRIELIDYDKLSVLANIAEAKEILRMKTEKLGNFIYANTSETTIDKKKLMKLMVLDIIHTEKMIQDEIKKVVNK